MTARAMIQRALGALLLAVAVSRAAPAQTSAAPWYRKSRVMELTGRNPRDSIVLTATGPRADQLAVVMTFYVGGIPVLRERWASEDELYERESLRKSKGKLEAFMRARLDTIVQLVKRQPIDSEQVAHMGDPAVLRRITPRPTHWVVLSYAFESSSFYAWDPVKRRFVLFMECC